MSGLDYAVRLDSEGLRRYPPIPGGAPTGRTCVRFTPAPPGDGPYIVASVPFSECRFHSRRQRTVPVGETDHDERLRGTRRWRFTTVHTGPSTVALQREQAYIRHAFKARALLLREKWRHRRREEYMERMAFLQEEAQEEGLSLNRASRRDFERFALKSSVRKGDLVLVGEGDLRAVWRGSCGAQVGLHFLGGGQVRYVLFSASGAGVSVRPVYGTCAAASVDAILTENGLRSLIYG